MSVDIDLDYIPNLTREETVNERERLTEILKGYMSEQGYFLSDASRFSHSLDAFHYNYMNAAGNKDMIKIEIKDFSWTVATNYGRINGIALLLYERGK